MISTSVFKSRIVVGVSYIYALLFVYAATSKLVDFENFRVQLAQSPLLSSFAEWVAVVIPVIELLIAGVLFFTKYRLQGLYFGFTLMVMFTTYIYIILNYSDYVPCSCGGVLEKMSWTEHLFFNVAVAVLAVVAVPLYPSHNNLQQQIS